MLADKIIIYTRVSTQQQGRSGLGLEAQRAAVMSYLQGRDWTLLGEYTEVESGRNSNRPELVKALRHAEVTGSTLVVAKLDRLSRDAAFLITLQKSPVRIVFADMPQADRLMIGLMAVLAEWEAEQISHRTKAALAAAKARGVKLGGNRGHELQAKVASMKSAAIRTKASADRAAKVMHYVEQARAAGHSSLRQIGRYLDEHGVTTPRGKSWSASAVRSLIRHAEGDHSAPFL